MALQVLVQEDFPALVLNGRLVDLRRVVNDADALPQVGYGIGVVRVEGQVLHGVRQVVQVVDDGLVQRLQPVFILQALDHIVAGHQDVPGIVAADDVGIQRFVGFIGLVVHLAVVFLFEIPQHVLVDILTPVVNVQRHAAEILGSVLAEGEEGQRAQHHRQRQQYGKGLFHVQTSSLLIFLSLRTGIRLARISITVTTTTITADNALTAGLNRFIEYTNMEMF